MIELNKEYEVYDSQDRYWGDVKFIRIFQDYVHGYLEPEPAYEPISKLFKEHEEALNEEKRDIISKKIVNLKVRLIRKETGNIISPGVVFVSEKYLLTCARNENEI